MANKLLLGSIMTATVMLMSGCQTTPQQAPTSTSAATAPAPAAAKSFHNKLYLRGVFTWWDAEEGYRVKRVDDERYMSQAELIADGQPYEFKFADAAWSDDANCGYKNKDQQNIKLDQATPANCSSSALENFKFTPTENGIYNFYIDFSDDTPMVTVEKDEP